MNKRVTFLIGMSGILAFFSCKSMEAPVMPSLKDVPDTFLDYQDSSSMAGISWKDFFNDPNLINLIDYALAHNLNLLSTI